MIMKKSVYSNPQKDVKLIAILSAILVAFIVLAAVINGSTTNGDETDDTAVSSTPLPSESTINTGSIVISEIVSNNKGIYASEDGLICDYIEIYNGSSSSVDISGYGLSDVSDEIKWVFPSGTVISAGEYLVVNLTGENAEGLNANFKLSSSGGEEVILTNASSKIIDAAETVAMGKNQSMARDENGQWVVYDYATPGQENSETGLANYIDSLAVEEDPQLVVNEVLPSNQGNFINEYGQIVGYIEVKNVSDEAINLSDYYISNDTSVPYKYQFEDVVLQPGEVYAIYATDATVENSTVTGFSFTNKAGYVVIAKAGTIVQKLQYSNLTNGLAYIRNDDGSYSASSFLSFGYDNTSEGIAAFQNEYQTIPEGLIISEVMNNNHTMLAQNSGNYYDWIELYNNSDSSINLSDYYLSTSDDSLLAYQLPDVTLEPGEYYVIICSGDSNLSNQSYQHAGFKIGSNESIYLTKDGEIVDCMYVAEVPTDYSYGRNLGSGGFYYMSTPTPNAANKSGTRVVSAEPTFTTTSGIYDDVESVSVEIEGNGTIYYTTDGSTPTTSSKVYEGPIVLTETTVIHARVYNDGEIMSDTVSSSYIINEYHTLPVMSVSMSPSGFTAMNSYPAASTERQAYAEFWEEGGSFTISCSISLVGGNTRYDEKKSYCLRFDSDWGPSDLVYPMFDSRDNSVYDALVLRTGSNDEERSVIRDTLSASLVDEYTDIDTQAYKYCVLYVNGEYYGIYCIREKINANYVTMHYNVAKNLVNLFRIDGEISSGSKSGWNSLVSYVKSHDVSDDEVYEYICSQVDIENLIDYWICEMYPYNQDVKNIRLFSCSLVDDGKWKYIYYDLDTGFRYSNTSKNYYTNYLTNSNGITGFINNTYDNTLPRKLFQNEEFCELFLQRLSYHLSNTWSKENVQARYDELVALLEPEIERDRETWGFSLSTYYAQLEDIQNFIDTRTDYVLTQTKSFFGLTDAQMEEYFGDLW